MTRRRKMWFWVGGAVLFVVLIAVGVFLFQDRLVYFPAPYPTGRWDEVDALRQKQQLGFELEDRFFDASDGVHLHAWLAKNPKATPNGPFLLWFHGNAGNLTYFLDDYKATFSNLPVEGLLVEYRGFGRSEGDPSEEGLYADAEGAWTYLTQTLNVPPERIVVYGFSLGGGVATELASRHEPAGLVVQSSFTSIPDVANSIAPVVPDSWVKSQMRSVDKVAQIHCPKLFVHSTGDRLIPFELGKQLFQAASEPKAFYKIEGFGHNETLIGGGADYLNRLGQFLKQCVPTATN